MQLYVVALIELEEGPELPLQGGHKSVEFS